MPLVLDNLSGVNSFFCPKAGTALRVSPVMLVGIYNRVIRPLGSVEVAFRTYTRIVVRHHMYPLPYEEIIDILHIGCIISE